MRLVIGLIIFWISIFSIKLFIEKKIKVPNIFSLPLTFTFIGLYMFVLGIINMMKLGSLILIFLSMIYFIYLIYKKELTKDYVVGCLKNPINILMILMFLFITIISSNLHLIHYDNYSHWGLITRVLFDFDRLPNFENNYVLFKGYQPGSACFIYLMGLLCGKKDYVMIIGQNYLVFAYFTVLFKMIKDKKDILKGLLLVCLYVFITVTSCISYNNLLVDTLIGVMLVLGLLIINHYKKDVKKAFLYSLPVMIYLLLVKNIGLVLAGFMCLYLLYRSYVNSNFKNGFKYVIYTGLILLLVLFIWNSHVSLVYGHWALNTKHSLSLQNIYTSLKAIGISNIISFIKMYLLNIFNFTSSNLPNIYMLILNVVGVIFGLLVRNKNKVFKYILLLDFIYLFYYFILGFMYIFSMPWEEAKVLAGYSRYMMTIVDVIVCLFIVYLFNYDRRIKYKNIFIVSISILLLSSIYIDYGSFLCMIGKDGYEGSLVSGIDKNIDKIPTDKDNYYLYPGDNDPYYFKFVLNYKLQKNNVYIIGVDCGINDVGSDSYLLFYDKELDSSFEKINNITYYKK